jgi:arsenite/tail-anchored protein-transporting ATPase
MTQCQVHFFAGKGGAGKTIVSTSYALNLAEEHGKDRVLLLAFEQDGGLADLLKKKLTVKPAKLLAGKGQGGLFVGELELPTLGEALAKELKPALTGAVGKGGVELSDDESKRLVESACVNLGELAALRHLMELANSGEWEHIVVDGLSTAHALRFFDYPAVLKRQITLIRGDHKYKATKNAPPRPVTSADPWAAFVETTQAFVKDPKRFAVHVVTVAEPVGDAQTRMLVKGLTDRGIPMAQIVANLIEAKSPSREVSNRRGLQAPHVRKYQTLHPKVELLPRHIVGPQGLDEAKKFAKDWAAGKEGKALAFAPSEAPPALVRAPSMPPIAAPPLPPTRYIFFVGAGGVGKSSCAAAAAVTLTEKEGPVLLLSVDPCHNLSDVLLSKLTDTETQVKGTKGLYAREIDFANWFSAYRKKLKELADSMFGPESKSEPFAVDRELIRNLFDFAPAGMDEFAALTALTDALVQERFKRIVIDPAPSANSVRILELPPIAKAWFAAIQQVAAKHKTKGAPLAAFCEAQIKHIERFEKAILNPNECRFVVVTRGEELQTPPAERLVEYLKAKNLPVERVLVNRVLPKTVDEVTEERRRNELEVAKVVEKKIGLPVTMAPALGRHPAGLRELKAFRTSWYALSATAGKVKAA